MAKQSLRSLTINALSHIIAKFGTWQTPRIFHNEAQFKFELGWELYKRYKCNVEFEVYTMDLYGKRVYTDFVLESGDYRVAIELKYKTADLPNYQLLSHGATILGRYDFLWDVNRLEYLIHCSKKQNIANANPSIHKQCNKGFAVMLTNEGNYWTPNYAYSIMTQKNRCYQDFCFSEYNWNGQNQLGKQYLSWKPLPKYAGGRIYPITLLQRYTYQWQNYCVVSGPHNTQFKYVIFEI